MGMSMAVPETGSAARRLRHRQFYNSHATRYCYEVHRADKGQDPDADVLWDRHIGHRHGAGSGASGDDGDNHVHGGFELRPGRVLCVPLFDAGKEGTGQEKEEKALLGSGGPGFGPDAVLEFSCRHY